MRMGKPLTSFVEILDPNFINNELLGQVGAEKVVTIKGFEEAEFFDSKTQRKSSGAAVCFEECLPLLLNATNTKTLKRLFSPNSDETANAIGHKVVLYVTTTHKPGGAKGEMTNCVRIKEYSETKCEECGAIILPASGKSVEQLVEISKRNTGKVLCIACMKKYKEKMTNEQSDSDGQTHS